MLIAGGGTEIDLPFFNSINLYSDIIHSEVQAKKTNNQTFIGGAGGFKFNGETGSINNSEGKSFINGGLGGIPYGGFGGGATTIDNITGGAGGFIGGNSGNYTNNTIFHTYFFILNKFRILNRFIQLSPYLTFLFFFLF